MFLAFKPVFMLVDEVTGDNVVFPGTYNLTIVGGGNSIDEITSYSDKERYDFNHKLGFVISLRGFNSLFFLNHCLQHVTVWRILGIGRGMVLSLKYYFSASLVWAWSSSDNAYQ